MYHTDVIAERLARAKEHLGWEPVYHSVEEVDMVNARLHNLAIFDDNGKFTGKLVRDYTEQEKWWIRNERSLCACDASYFLTRYCYVKTDKNEIIRFKFRDPQRVYFNVIAELESRGSAIQLQILKARQLGMCLHPDTKVLTSDLRWVRIDDVQPGDVLIGVDEGLTQEGWKAQQTAKMRRFRAGQPRPEKRQNLPERKMRNTVVEAKREVFEKAVLIRMENGKKLTATPQHRFLVKQRSGGQPLWKTVSEMQPGDSIRHITSTWGEPTYEDGWFGGLFDGEGSMRSKCGIGVEACVAQVEGKVLTRAKNWLDDNGFSYREEIDRRKGGESSKLGNKPVHKLVISRMNEAFRLVGMTQPSRFKRDWWVGKSLPGKKSGDAWTKIESMDELPIQRMIDIQTSAKTFIAEGFVSHNSTITELLVLHRVLFYYGTNAVVASSAVQQTQIMSGMIYLAYDRLPHWISPVASRRVESDAGHLAFKSIQTGISFQHGSQTTGIARGHTPTVVHLSEVASFANSEDLIDNSLFKAVHESENVFMVLESTAEGIDNWWHKKWKSSKAGWAKGESRLCPLFLPWYLGTDLYPTQTWIQARRENRPDASTWRPIKETRAMMAKAQMYVASSELLSSILGDNWEMGIDQAWWWQVQFEEARSMGGEKGFLQEMPNDDIEAFQSSFDSVFGNNLLDQLNETRQKDYQIFGMKGNGIEDRYEPDEYDEDYSSNATRKMIRYGNNRGDTYSWEFIPLRRDCIEDGDGEDLDKAVLQADCKLLVFREPEDGYDYTIGVDTSGGKGADSTVIEVWRKGVHGMPDVQAAEFACAYIPHTDAFAFVMPIAAYYSRFMKKNSIHREPLVSVEQIAAVGDTCQVQMRKMGYARFHSMIRYDTKKLQKKKATKMGWFTSGWSRPILLGGFEQSVKNEWAVIHSPFLLREMKSFEVHSTGQREKQIHSDGSHDDRIFASAIAIFTSHDLEAIVNRSTNRPVPIGIRNRPQIDLRPPQGWTVPTHGGSLAELTIPVNTINELEDFLASERLAH